MTERLQTIYNMVLNKEHRKFRQNLTLSLCEEFFQRGLSPVQRVAERFVRLAKAEKPVILPGERIVLMRTIKELPELFTQEEWEKIKSEHFLHEKGSVCNINPGYGDVIASGLNKVKADCKSGLQKHPEAGEFYSAILSIIDAIIDLCDRYRCEAEKQGNAEVAAILSHLPQEGARNFHEALQMFRILHYSLWVEGEYHNTVGRFDQYIYPYLKKDLETGVLNETDAFDLLEEFFLSFNKDSDLYFGVQQGDNGQSLVLGGCDKDGNDCFNMLSKMCLKASGELKMIDPKINLRVGKQTDIEVYRLGTELTKKGLGFPQYSNDDVVIPGLTALGYQPQDAADYAMAACWEFIIPFKGMDIPNIGALSFPLAVDGALHKNLISAQNFEDFISCVEEEIRTQCDDIADSIHNLWMIPAPLMSVMMYGCLQNGFDISSGCIYNNFGIHGTGLSTAVDSLAAVKKYIYEEKTVAPEEMIDAVDKDFQGYDELLNELRVRAPKMGNNNSFTNDIACRLLSIFADALKGRRNERGGCYRAGTGSAMYYLWHTDQIGASPDGRQKHEPFSANYAPSLFAKMDGPLSVIQAFVKPDFTQIINGGPLTLEFHESIFRNEESKEKVAMLVQQYIQLGGHQLQLNAVNRDILLQAQKNPSDYKNLIVRIWGWSAYFVELDKDFQDHVIRRQEYIV